MMAYRMMTVGLLSVALAAGVPVLWADQHGHDHTQPQAPQAQAPGSAPGGMGMMARVAWA